MKQFLKAFRSGIKFSGRFFKNAKIQGEWFWNVLMKWEKGVRAWRVRNNYNKFIEYMVEVLGILFLIFIVLPFLMLWAFLKSI